MNPSPLDQKCDCGLPNGQHTEACEAEYMKATSELYQPASLPPSPTARLQPSHSPTPWYLENYEEAVLIKCKDGGTPIAMILRHYTRKQVNAALIVEAVNSHDSLKADYAKSMEVGIALRTRVVTLEKALEKYGRHLKRECYEPNSKCSCGYTEVRNG